MSTSTLEPIAAPKSESPPSGPNAHPAPLWRKALPFVIAIGLVAFTLSRIDLRAFVTRLSAVNAPRFIGFTVAFVISLLTADAFATVTVYRRNVARVRFIDFWFLRGASYLPALLNHHVGQAFLTYYLARDHGVSLARMAGATLLVYASWAGCLLGFGCLAMLQMGTSHMLVAAVFGSGIVYLVIIALRPKVLARVKLLSPLFEAGVQGHVVALLVRIPHFVVQFMGVWVPFFFFGIDIPLSAALVYVPIIMVAVTLPITPQGAGTRDLLAVTFFSAFAPGVTAADKSAAIVAVTTSTLVATTLVNALVGLLLLRRAIPNENRKAAAA